MMGVAKLFKWSRQLWTSLSARLTVWFAVMAFLLLITATMLMYWKVVSHLSSEDEALASMKLMLVEAMLSDAMPARTTVQAVAASDSLPLERPLQVRVLRPDGSLLAETEGMGAELPAALFPASRKPTIITGNSGENYWATSSTVNGKIVQVASEADDEMRLLAPYRGRLWILFGIAFFLAGGVGHLISRHGIRPLKTLVNTMRGIETTTLDQRIDVSRLPIELAALGQTFNDMLERLQLSFTRVANVSDDIAPQLRTPLGIIRGQIEVALGADRTAADYKEILESSLEEVVTLSDLVHRMLFLARAENQALDMSQRAVDVGGELIAVRELYEPVAGEAGVSLDAASPASPLTVTGDPLLIRRALGNLVSNAIRHTPKGGSVTMTAERNGGEVRVSVIDTGCGIADTHLGHMFERFYRADRSSAGAGGNSGLGLAIVKAIATLHGGTVSIASTVGTGTRVTVSLPAAR